MRTRLLTLVLFGLLPLSAGAGPLVIDLKSDRHPPSAKELAGIGHALQRFEATLAHGDSADFAGLFDPTRATLLWARVRSAQRDLDYGPALTGWLPAANAGAAANHEALRRTCAETANLLRASSLDPPRHALVYADSTLARRLWPRGGLPGLHIRHGQRRDDHPLLIETLELTCLTDLTWQDPRCDSWRSDYLGPTRACPLQPAFLRIEPPRWATATERKAWLDSLARVEPTFAKAGWLKRRLLRGGLERMTELLAVIGGARELWRDQQRGAVVAASSARARIAGPPPAPPPADRAVLRLLFLKDSRVSGRWLLALAWLAPQQLGSPGDSVLEPGFGPWADRYALWREEALARIEAAVDQR